MENSVEILLSHSDRSLTAALDSFGFPAGEVKRLALNLSLSPSSLSLSEDLSGTIVSPAVGSGLCTESRPLCRFRPTNTAMAGIV